MKRLAFALALGLANLAHADTTDQQLAERTMPYSGTRIGFATECNQVGKAYAYINANRDVWVTLSQGSLISSSNWCEDQNCKLVEGLEYDTEANFNLYFSPTYKMPFNNPTTGLMTPGAYLTAGGYGALCGGPGTECAGDWPGDWCVGFESLYGTEAGVSAVKDWMAAGYSEPFTFYAGRFGDRGTQVGDICNEDHGCTWFTVVIPARLGNNVHGWIEWRGFYTIQSGSWHPNCCNKECCQLVKPTGTDTGAVPAPWAAIKSLYR